MSSLLELHEKYDAVKARKRYAYARTYLTDVYPQYFELKRQTATKILEIGIFKGGSICAMRDYFPNAEIVGADVVIQTAIRRACEKRIKLIQADQGKSEDLERLGAYGPFDFIIEDGSHKYEHQVLALDTLPQYLKEGGVLFIEDVVDRHKGWHIMGYAKNYKREGYELVYHPGMIVVKRV